MRTPGFSRHSTEPLEMRGILEGADKDKKGEFAFESDGLSVYTSQMMLRLPAKTHEEACRVILAGGQTVWRTVNVQELYTDFQ